MIPYFNLRTAGLAVALLAHLLQWVYYYPKLPMRVASHFNAMGEVDGWASRNHLLLINAGFVGLMFFLAFLLPWLIRFLPISMVNIPNKQYWATPERWPVVEHGIEIAMQWLALLTYSWMIALNHLTLRVSLKPETQRQLGLLFPVLLGIYLAGMAVWIIRLYWVFRLPRDR
ncbi:MAG TPA: DUF1648 domain-containing protein [Candidatus Paceibacterota bacterium]|nr:DUF1648 domain-containing protein [Verrucomicrobiota bacterium]HRY48924.1 DUF1648 domain-containing protein [Candidatus Paceibacterota bacterium]HRZ99136.1 DUF1648 domain-containing protein [Candidatus Paceibacterota bacterium]